MADRAHVVRTTDCTARIISATTARAPWPLSSDFPAPLIQIPIADTLCGDRASGPRASATGAVGAASRRRGAPAAGRGRGLEHHPQLCNGPALLGRLVRRALWP